MSTESIMEDLDTVEPPTELQYPIFPHEPSPPPFYSQPRTSNQRPQQSKSLWEQMKLWHYRFELTFGPYVMDTREKLAFYVVFISLILAILFLSAWSCKLAIAVLGRARTATWVRWMAVERGRELLEAVQMTDAEGFGREAMEHFAGNSSMFAP
jgi:hypothetical protein